jgi:hypothetical protein
MDAELGIFLGEDWWLGGPQRVRRLEAVHGVGGAELAGLNDEGDESGDEKQKTEGAAEPAARRHS